MSIAKATVRTYARYLVPLVVLSAIAFAPVLVIALRITPPADVAGARAVLRLTYALAGAGWLCLLVLVGGAASAVAGGSQLRVLVRGVVGLARAIVPCAVAVAAIAIGALALAVPAVVLAVLLAPTGACTGRGARAALVESLAIGQRRWRTLAVILGLTIIAAIAVVYLAQRVVAPLPLPAQPSVEQLVAFQRFARVAIVALVVLAPLSAIALATTGDRAA